MSKLGKAYLSLFTCILSFVMIGVIVSLLPKTDKNEPPILTEDEYLSQNCHHIYGEWETILASTCTTTGKQKQICTICNYENTRDIGKVEHSYEIFREEKPTCFERGTAIYKCANCTASYVEDLSPQHTYVVDEAVAPTCTTTGLTEGQHCTACGEISIAQYEVEALGHTEVTDEAVAPTCITIGLTEGSHCSVCNTVLVAQTEISLVAHTEEIIPAVAPTCDNDGLTEGTICTVCNTILVKQETIDALPHTPTENWIQGTSYWYKECTVCGTKTETSTNPTFSLDVYILSAYMQTTGGNYANGAVAHVTSDYIYNITANGTVTYTLQAVKTYTGYCILTVSSQENCTATLVHNGNGLYTLTISSATGNAIVQIGGSQPPHN